jgi:hypothetical protein
MVSRHDIEEKSLHCPFPRSGERMPAAEVRGKESYIPHNLLRGTSEGNGFHGNEIFVAMNPSSDAPVIRIILKTVG